MFVDSIVRSFVSYFDVFEETVIRVPFVVVQNCAVRRSKSDGLEVVGAGGPSVDDDDARVVTVSHVHFRQIRRQEHRRTLKTKRKGTSYKAIKDEDEKRQKRRWCMVIVNDGYDGG